MTVSERRARSRRTLQQLLDDREVREAAQRALDASRESYRTGPRQDARQACPTNCAGACAPCSAPRLAVLGRDRGATALSRGAGAGSGAGCDPNRARRRRVLAVNGDARTAVADFVKTRRAAIRAASKPKGRRVTAQIQNEHTGSRQKHPTAEQRPTDRGARQAALRPDDAARAQEVELAKAELVIKGKRAGVGAGMFGGAGCSACTRLAR